jgi:hypothetical protein
VVVPRALRKAFEGRQRITLGVPATSHVGDVVATLLSLYPQMRHHLSDDRNPESPGVQLFLGDHASEDLAHRGTGLTEGARLYLFALVPKRLSDA